MTGDSNEHEGEAKTPSGPSVLEGRDYQDDIIDFEKKVSRILKRLITGWLTKMETEPTKLLDELSSH